VKYLINILFLLLFCGQAWGFGNGAIPYEDPNFTAAESPVTLDLVGDLTTEFDSGESVFADSVSILNTGKYDITIEISFNGKTYIAPQTLGPGATDNGGAAGARTIRISHTGNDSGYQVKAWSRFAGTMFTTTGTVNTNIIDNDTEPIDILFAENIGSFILSADTVASGLTAGTLVYTFTANSGHGLVAGDEILLLSTDRSFYATVITAGATQIVVDRPIDFVYLAGVALIINTNMAVDGSVTPRVFKMQAGLTPNFIRRVIVTMVDGTSMDDTTFAGMPALSNGLVMRFVNSFQKTIFNFKTNGDFAQWAYDLDYSDKRPAGSYGMRSRITFGGMEKHGVILEVSGNDEVQFVVQDDLTDADSIVISGQGNKK